MAYAQITFLSHMITVEVRLLIVWMYYRIKLAVGLLQLLSNWHAATADFSWSESHSLGNWPIGTTHKHPSSCRVSKLTSKYIGLFLFSPKYWWLAGHGALFLRYQTNMMIITMTIMFTCFQLGTSPLKSQNLSEGWVCKKEIKKWNQIWKAETQDISTH